MFSIVHQYLKRVGLVAGALVATSACTASMSSVQAQNVATNIPVLVVAEDQDTNSVNHCSDVHKRVIAELRGRMQSQGYQTLDEESIRADLGWNETCTPPFDDDDRRSKQLLVSDIKRMMSANSAQIPARVWVLYRVNAQKVPFGSGYDAQVRVSGEIYDALSNNYLDGFQGERLRFPLPDNCGKVCVYEILGDHASDIAANLGEILGRKLERHSPAQTASTAAAGAVTANSGGGSGLCDGLLTPYNLELKYFDKVESASIVGVMADEFPCYHSHDLLSGGEAVRKYAYSTRAKKHKLQEWFIILLRDMGFEDQDYAMEVNGNNFVISKLTPTPDRERSEDETSRFN